MASPTTPLINTQPGQKSRLATAIEGSQRQLALNPDSALPAKVISYDRVKNVAEVQPLIKIVKLDNTVMSRHPLAFVPVISMGGGGFNINFPLKAGDFGWIFATDRDYSIFMETLEESAPGTSRAHKFDDSILVPDVLRNYTIDGADTTAMVIQTTDAKTRIVLDADGSIRITAEAKVEVTAPTATITASTSVTVDTPQATFNHNVEIKGNLVIDGTTNAKGTLTNNSINVTTHGHVSTSPGTRTENMEP